MGVVGCVLGALFALALGACGGTSGSEGQQGGGEPIVFAVVGPLTGDNAIYGTNLRKGVELASEEINDKGGIDGRDVEIRAFDDKCDPTEAANVASRIASNDEIFAVIGHVCSSSTLAALPVYQRSGTTVVSASSTAPNITRQGYENFSRTIPSDAAQGTEVARLAVDVLGLDRVGVLYANDDYGQGLFKGATDAISAAGGSLAGSETYTPTTTKDFSPQLTKLSGQEPKALAMLGFFNDMGTMVTQLGRTGLGDIVLIGAAGVAQPDYVELGGERTEGTYLLSYYDPDSPLPANAAFVRRFEKRYDEQPNEQAAYGYEIPFVYKEAIEAGGDKENLTEAVRKVTYKGPTGLTKFDDRGDVVGKAGVVLRVEDGQLKLNEKLTKAVNPDS